VKKSKRRNINMRKDVAMSSRIEIRVSAEERAAV
jgi:hypothetical protein